MNIFTGMTPTAFAVLAAFYLLLGGVLWVWAAHLDRMDSARRRTGRSHRRLTVTLAGIALLGCLPLSLAFFMLGLSFTH